MLSKACTSAYALRIPALLIALTAGIVPALAQRVPVSLPAELTYVSLSGAVTLGFSQYLKEHPGAVDPVGIMPPETQVPGLCRQLLDDMWQGSPTFRRQWTRLAGARVRVSIVLNPMLSGWTRAHAQLSRTPDLRVQIYLPLVNRSAIESLAHEIEHVLEALDGVDLPEAVAQRVHGATAVGRPPAFETNRAKAIGRLVLSEVTAYQARR
ncbi:MAG TPA: hypothetical protein VFT47_00270 [Vicinamibacterales bacterium]|nr:hypothetical protein [Vicinamibacterales bacterium]